MILVFLKQLGCVGGGVESKFLFEEISGEGEDAYSGPKSSDLKILVLNVSGNYFHQRCPKDPKIASEAICTFLKNYKENVRNRAYSKSFPSLYYSIKYR